MLHQLRRITGKNIYTSRQNRLTLEKRKGRLVHFRAPRTVLRAESGGASRHHDGRHLGRAQRTSRAAVYRVVQKLSKLKIEKEKKQHI